MLPVQVRSVRRPRACKLAVDDLCGGVTPHGRTRARSERHSIAGAPGGQGNGNCLANQFQCICGTNQGCCATGETCYCSGTNPRCSLPQ